MAEIQHRFVDVAGLRMHIAEAGTGPLVILLHGMPECWYSWRHQLVALADAGFHVVAPDQRGYARTDAPASVDAYSIIHLVGDVVGLIAALGEPNPVLVGHDFGSAVAWQTAQLRPDLLRGLAVGLPFTGRAPTADAADMTTHFGKTFYHNRFQTPGAEKDFEDNPTEAFRRLFYGISGDIPEPHNLHVPEGKGFFETFVSPEVLPAWITEEDIAAYVAEFSASGFSGPLGWYRNLRRNWELTAPWQDVPITTPSFVFIGEKDPVRTWFPTGPDLAGLLSLTMPNLVGETRVFPGIGHWIQQETPDEFNKVLIEFLGALD